MGSFLLLDGRWAFQLGHLLFAFLPDHFQQIQDVFILVLDVTFLEIHLALVQQIGHVLVTQVPFQKPPEYTLQP